MRNHVHTRPQPVTITGRDRDRQERIPRGRRDRRARGGPWRPVVTANQAMLRAALRAADAYPGSVSDYGSLFGHG